MAGFLTSWYVLILAFLSWDRNLPSLSNPQINLPASVTALHFHFFANTKPSSEGFERVSKALSELPSRVKILGLFFQVPDLNQSEWVCKTSMRRNLTSKMFQTLFMESQALEAGGDFQSRLIKHSVGRLVLMGGNAES